MRQPYGRAIASTPTYAHPAWYAAQGFLVVVQDVRGQGGSEGTFTGFGQEARDTADSLRWARRLEGSNGRVGLYGFSYQGLTQLLSDAVDEQGLPDCLAPAMAGLDECRHWACSGGAHWWALGLGWGLQLAALRCRRRGDLEGWRRIRRSLDAGRFLEEGPELLEELDPQGMAQRWLGQDPAVTQDWVVHEPPARLWRRPMLLIGGWHDPHLEGVLDLWRRARAAGGRPLLRIGAWTHLNWGDGVDGLLARFFRHHLQDPASGEFGEPEVAVQGGQHGPWWSLSVLLTVLSGEGADSQDERDQLAWRRWWLRDQALLPAKGGDAGLAQAAAPDSGERRWIVHDPWRPVPGRGGHLGLDAGPCERGDLDQRRDVACFTSPPLERPLRLLARPRLRLRMSADQPGFDLCAALSRVTPDGGVQQLSTGISRQLGAGCQQAEWREVQLQPLLLELQPGERLRLSLAAAAWPQVAVNAGTGELPRGGSGPEHRVITLELNCQNAELRLEPVEGLDPGANCGLPCPPP